MHILMDVFAHPVDKDLPPPPAVEQEVYGQEEQDDGYSGDGPVIPNYLTAQSTGYTTKRLSTISEHTEESRAWTSRQDFAHAQPYIRPSSTQTTSSYGQILHRPQSAAYAGSIPQTPKSHDTARSGYTTTDYGEVIGESIGLLCLYDTTHCSSETERVVDPNLIYPSPSSSARQHLSIRTPSPTLSGGSESSGIIIPVPPPIRDFVESPAPQTPDTYERPRSSFYAQPPISTSKPTSESSGSRRQSLRELSEKNISRHNSSNFSHGSPSNAKESLAPESEKTQSQISRLSRSSSGKSSSTIRAQPTSQAIPPHSTNSDADLTDSPRRSKLASLASSRALASRDKTLTHTSSFVSTGSTVTYPILRPTSLSIYDTQSSDASSLPLSPDSAANPEISEMSRTPASEYKPLVRSLAPTPSQAKSAPDVSTLQPQVAKAPSSKGPSKLSLLAKSKVTESLSKARPPKVLSPPYAHTKYLSPTSNGSAMTTAITTYIQTPDNMLSLAKARLPPSYPPEQVGKQSKLSLKAKSSQKRSGLSSGPRSEISEEPRVITLEPIYERKQRSSATPSPFASLLADNQYNKLRKTASNESNEEERKRRKQRKNALLPAHLLSPSTSTGSMGFAFDVPSPDDVVINARKGTSLGSTQRSPTQSRRTASVDSRSRA